MEYYNYHNLNKFSPVVTTGTNTNNQINTTSQSLTFDPRLNYAYCGSSLTAKTTTHLPNQFPFETTQAYDLTLPNSAPDIVTKTDDELWIETWLSKIGKIQINLNSTVEVTANANQNKAKPFVKNSMQIHAAKSALRNCLLVISRLQEMHEFLKSNAATMSSTEWRKKTLEIGSIKNEFSKLFLPFENSDTMNQLRRTVESRRKKRESQKRRRAQRSEYKAQLQEERKKAHDEIDRWLQNMKEQAERVKMEENMKKDADCVLAEVTKKKSDARKWIALITSLVKLRHVREQAAIQRGEKVSTEDRIAFAKVTDRLTKIWVDALRVYSKEEQGLRVMLEQNATEDTIAARAAKERQLVQEWDEVFFGPKCIPSAAYWGLMAAEKDLETFIAIRKSWDTFLTDANDENGSRIPIGWVAPNPNAHESWTRYLQPV